MSGSNADRPHSKPTAAMLLGLGLLLSAPALAADGFAKPSAESPVAPAPAPVVSSYTPLPASYDQPITIHGTHLLPANAAPTTAIEEVPKTVLFWGNHKDFGPIPESDILSWTDTSIQISGLPDAPQGVYGIILLRGNVIVSNFNQTLLLENGRPREDDESTLADLERHQVSELPLGQLGKLPTGPIEPSPTAVAKDFFIPEPDPNKITALPPDAFLGLETPTSLEAWVAGYAPALVGADEEITISGFFPVSQNRRLVFGVLGNGVRSIKPDKVKSWSTNAIVLQPGAVPMGVWWVAVFAMDLQASQITLVSNLNTGLQVTGNAPPQGGSNDLMIRAEPHSGDGPGGSSARSRMKVAPQPEAERGLEKIDPSIRKAPAATRALEPRVPEAAPKATAPADLQVKPAAKPARKTTPGAVPSERIQPVPAPVEPKAEPRMIRKLR